VTPYIHAQTLSSTAHLVKAHVCSVKLNWIPVFAFCTHRKSIRVTTGFGIYTKTTNYIII